MSIPSKDSRRRSLSNRKQRRATRVRQSARSRKSMTTCGCCSPGSASLLPGDRPAHREPDRFSDGRPDRRRWSRARGCTCWRPSCADARASTGRSSQSCRSAFQHPGRRRDVRYRGCADAWTRSASTTSRSWLTGWSCAPTLEQRVADSFETALALTDGLAYRGKRR